MKGPYIDEDHGDVWIERGSAPWPRIQREGFATLYEMGFDDPLSYRREYLGIETDVTVSDERENVHLGAECREAIEDDMEEGEHLPDDFVPCCRLIEAHHFRGTERA